VRVVRRWREQIDGVILRSTARRWHRLIVRVLCRAHTEGVITTRQLQILTREFDPRQDGTVGRLPRVVDPRFADIRPAAQKDLALVRREGPA
jgi:hypothetical protein